MGGGRQCLWRCVFLQWQKHFIGCIDPAMWYNGIILCCIRGINNRTNSDIYIRREDLRKQASLYSTKEITVERQINNASMPSLTSQWPSRDQHSDHFFSDEHQEKVGKGTFQNECRGLHGFNPLNRTTGKNLIPLFRGWVYFTLGKCTSTHFQ